MTGDASSTVGEREDFVFDAEFLLKYKHALSCFFDLSLKIKLRVWAMSNTVPSYRKTFLY